MAAETGGRGSSRDTGKATCNPAPKTVSVRAASGARDAVTAPQPAAVRMAVRTVASSIAAGLPVFSSSISMTAGQAGKPRSALAGRMLITWGRAAARAKQWPRLEQGPNGG